MASIVLLLGRSRICPFGKTSDLQHDRAGCHGDQGLFMDDCADLKARFRASLDRAIRALDSGDEATATTECIDAANFAWACLRRTTAWDSPEYIRAWHEFTFAVGRLPPTVLRRAVNMLLP